MIGEAGGRRTPGPLRAFGALTEILNGIGTAWIFGLLVLINSDIGARALFNAPVAGVPEIVKLSIVGIVFLQAPHALRTGCLTRADVLYDLIQARHPRLGAALDFLFNLTGATLFTIIFFVSVPYFTLAWSADLFIGTEGGFTAPTWPIKLITLIGCVVMSTQFLLLACQNLRRSAEDPGPS